MLAVVIGTIAQETLPGCGMGSVYGTPHGSTGWKKDKSAPGKTDNRNYIMQV